MRVTTDPNRPCLRAPCYTSVTVPGTILWQISLDLIEIEDDLQRKTVGYGFCSNELQELATMMFGTLSPEDVRKMVEIRCTDNFPYQLNGKLCMGSSQATSIDDVSR